ncbi:MAG: DUF1028 domain-containing protein [Acidimicrobiia bacterium]|nr:DUF1028 domain-containing protein [Acidimicrobiia bacterium]
MTYSIVARDPSTGEMGIATQSQALAVGASVPFCEPGVGVIATQSMALPAYGTLGLDLLEGGLTAPEALAALLSIDPHPERRQLAMIDCAGRLHAFTGEANVAEAGHVIGDDCATLANMMATNGVWQAMFDAYQATAGPLAERLMAALRAAERAGGDLRGPRSAALSVVRAERTGRPWRDRIVDLRVDRATDPVAELSSLVSLSAKYHQMVEAFELAIDGRPGDGLDALEELGEEEDPAVNPDLSMWRAVVLGLAGETAEARRVVARLEVDAPAFVETLRRFGPAGLLPDNGVLERILP